jgi:amino acid transporter
MVVLKIAVVLLVILAGAFYVKPENWSPFAPNGVKGVLSGVASVFFAFIGFDSISTTAEECRNPQRDMPRAMIYCLIICTVLYVLITLVLTGMVNYNRAESERPAGICIPKEWPGFYGRRHFGKLGNSDHQCIAGLSIGPAEDLDDHEPRWPPLETFCQNPP